MSEPGPNPKPEPNPNPIPIGDPVPEQKPQMGSFVAPIPIPVAVPVPVPAAEPFWLRIARWGFLATLIALVFLFHHIVMPFVLGTMIAFILAPVVSRVARLRVGRVRLSRGLGVVLVYITLGCGIYGVGRALLPFLVEDVGRLVRETPSFFAKVQGQYIPQAEAWLGQNMPAQPAAVDDPRPERKLRVTPLQNGGFDISVEALELEVEPVGKGRFRIGPRDASDDKQARLGDLFSQLVSSTESQVRSVLAFGQRFVGSVVKTIAWFVLMFMVAAYLLIDLERVITFVYALVPPEHRADAKTLLGRIEKSLDGVIRGQLIICVVNGILTTIGLLLFQVKYALLLGLIAGGMSFIPVFGSILSSIPIVLVALTSGDHGDIVLHKGLAMLAWILVIHFFEANLFNPKIIGDAAKIHPVIVVFALLVGEESGGLLGALVAVPIASILLALFVFLHERLMQPRPAP